jgi:formylglycine-generating enzyme required for sulfatase activity
MLHRILRHVRHNAVAYVALFFAMTGSAVAASTVLHVGDSAGGDLTGTYPNPQIAPGAVGTAKVADDSITAQKLACAGNSADDVMVRAGSVCIDKYEDSIWTARTGGTQITGAIPCNANGQDCDNIYARSVAGVQPASNITWFQAQAALANSGKRLPTNAEWQEAVRGTPDSTACNVGGANGSVASTGANAGCVSDFGAFDMVGNLGEWVADWVPRSSCVGSWSNLGSDDFQALCGAATEGEPGAIVRGGDFGADGLAGPFAVVGSFLPSTSFSDTGFRGAR